MISKITINGRTPSKKNSRNIFVRFGKLFNIPSKSYSEWHKESSKHLPKKPRGIEKVYSIKLEFWAPDKRKADISNKTESILDLFVDNGILKDDNWWIIDRMILVFHGLDRENPRCEVTIYHA
jgi:Holliday junction resolvase RusA-like endonuclease